MHVTCCRAAVVDVLGAAHATGPLNSLISAITAYLPGPNGYSAVKAAHLQLSDFAGNLGFMAVLKTKFATANDVALYSGRATAWKPTLSAIDTTGAAAYATAADTALQSMPATAGFEANMGLAKTSYNSLGSPPSQVSCASTYSPWHDVASQTGTTRPSQHLCCMLSLIAACWMYCR